MITRLVPRRLVLSVLLLSMAAGATSGNAQLASAAAQSLVQDSAYLWLRRGGPMPPPLLRMVTVDLAAMPLDRIVNDIARQAVFDVVFEQGAGAEKRQASLKRANVPAGIALLDALRGSGLEARVARDGRVVRIVVLSKSVPAAAGRQVGTITGWVTDAKTGEGIAGAEVLLEDTRWRATTDTAGRYRLAEIDTGSYTLTVRRLGYAKRSQVVAVAAEQETTVDLSLEPVATRLDELVTTATGPQRRLELANAVTVLRADSIVRTQPIKDVTDLLTTRVPGLAVLPTTGAPGDPARLRLRGSSSILRSNDPIVIVDGVRIYAEQSAERSASLANANMPAPSPLDRIDPNSIETIEVLNGPSAATLYGADAANGVIVITTKRGRPGPARWDVSLEHGREFLPGRFPNVYIGFAHTLDQDRAEAACALTTSSRPPTCVVDSVVAYQALNDPDLTALGQGHHSSLSTTVSGGRSDISYAITGSYSDAVGLLRLPRYEVGRFQEAFHREPEDWMQQPHQFTRWNLTSRLSIRPARTANMDLTIELAGANQGRSDLESELGVLRRTYVDKMTGLIYANGVTGNSSASLVPNFYRKTTNRALGLRTGVTVAWEPIEQLKVATTAGVHADFRRDESFTPRGILDDLPTGSLVSAQGTATMGTFTATANYAVPLGRGLQFNTGAGFQYTSQSVADLRRAGADPSSGVSTTLEAEQRRDDLTSHGWFVEPRISHNRFSVSTGLRLDGGSNYGASVKGFNGFKLPKLGGSWLISDEPFFPLKNSRLLNTLRLRAAYGQAGVQPGTANLARLLSAESPLLDGQVVEVARVIAIGNTRLRPERSTEVEWGFDADLLDNRLSVGLTGYRKTKNDALLEVELAPSVYSGRLLINVGVVRNTGFELTLHTHLLRTNVVNWGTDLQVSHNRNVVVSLADGVETFNLGSGSCEAQCTVPGYPLFGYWAPPVVGYADANGDGMLQRGEILLGDSSAYLGAPEPAYTASLYNTVGLFRGALTVTASLDYQDDFTQRNSGALTSGVLARAAVDPSAPLSDQALVISSAMQAGGLQSGLVQTVSVLRFHSLSVGWRLPQTVVRWLGAQNGSLAVQGTNLGLVTNYRGKDPLVNSLPAGNGVIDDGALPQPRQWQLRLQLSF